MKTTCWKFGGDEVPGGYKGLSERLKLWSQRWKVRSSSRRRNEI